MTTGLRHASLLRTLLAAICCVCLAGSAAAGSPATPQLPWGRHVLEVVSICANPENILNPAPETSDYYMLCLRGVSGPVAAYDIADALNAFALVDSATGDSYPAGAYLPYCIEYNDRAHVFTTAAEQTQFELFFVLPAGTALEALTLSIGEAELPLAGLDLLPASPE